MISSSIILFSEHLLVVMVIFLKMNQLRSIMHILRTILGISSIVSHIFGRKYMEIRLRQTFCLMKFVPKWKQCKRRVEHLEIATISDENWNIFLSPHERSINYSTPLLHGSYHLMMKTQNLNIVVFFEMQFSRLLLFLEK